MNDLSKLASEFSKLAEDYSDIERLDALMGNLRQAHHQVRNARLSLTPEGEQLRLQALRQIGGAIEALQDLKNSL